MTKSPRITENK